MNHSPSTLSYRPDIDGLRALAVLAVVFYHAGLGCPGGFVGVDVFFVISGYLITALILRDLRTDTFSLAEFWERRVRRILPAVSVCVAVTLAAGWFLLLPADLDALGRSAVAQSLMAANFFFWRNTNYFGGENLDKPLLHTWSLAVEEQFYLVLPLVLIVWFRFRKLRSTGGVIGLLGLGLLSSLALAVWGVVNQPYATFFLLPTRAWELLCGAMLAALPRQGMNPGWRRGMVGLLGLAGILLPVFLYSESTPFPGLAALPPCLGAAALIWANTPVGAERVGRIPVSARLLGLPALRFVGLISYSLYLWHWPVLVFANYWKTGDLGYGSRWGLVLVSLILAILSWRLVETPFRKRRAGVRRSLIFGSAAVACVGLLLAGFLLYRSEGFPERLSPRAAALVKAFDDEERARKQFHCPLNSSTTAIRNDEVSRIGKVAGQASPSFLLFGDSHAHLAAPLFDRMAKAHGVSGAVVTHAATPPLTGWRNRDPHGVRDPQPWFDATLEYIRRHQIRRVFLMATWAKYSDESSSETLVALLKDSVSAIRGAGAEVEVLMSPPIYSVNVQRVLLRQSYFGGTHDPIPYQTPEQHAARQSAVFKARDFLSTARFWDSAPGLLDTPKGIYRVMIEGRPLYVDHAHLSQFGVEKVWKPVLEQILSENFGGKSLE